MAKTVSIAVTTETRQRISDLGGHDDTYETILKRVLDHYEELTAREG
jgi:hypothetical protein